MRKKAITKIAASAGHTRRMMPIGDSITAGIPALIGGYRTPLFALNPGAVFVGRQASRGNHEGYSGYTIDQLQTTVPPSVVTAFNASVVLLMAGTNNLGAGESAATAFGKLQTYATALKAAAGVDYVLVSTICYYSPDPTRGAAYNALILGWSPGGGIVIVDACSTLSYPTDFADTLHPNGTGYPKLSNGWNSAVAALL